MLQPIDVGNQIPCRHILFDYLMNHQVFDQVLIPYIRGNLGASLVFDFSYVYVSFGAFGKFPIGMPQPKMEYFVEVECPSNNRYIRPVEWYWLTGRKALYL